MSENGITSTSTRPTQAGTRNVGLDVLRIISICGVVGIHVFGVRVGANPKSGASWWTATAIDIGAIWVVPVFIMISGALLLGSRQLTESPGRFYRRRAARIVPALVAWNLIYLVGVRIWMRHEHLGTGRILQMLYDSSVFTQLYFLWIILGLYAVAPFLGAHLQRGGRPRALASAGALLGVSVMAYMLPGILGEYKVPRPVTLNFMTLWIPYVGYFVAGYALNSVRLKGARLALAAAVTASMVAFTIWHYGTRGRLHLLDLLVNESYFGLVVALIAVGVFIVGASLGAGWKPGPGLGRALKALSDASFGVFLVHLVIFEAIRLQFPAVSTQHSLRALSLAYVVTLLASFAVSLAALRIPLLRRIF
ncbi:hypothetical protein B5P43_15475 [Bacillus sp. SRB_336]|nr:hypothetical protein B5P43_15475 [Bacillus sp. SRB_336]